MIQGRPVPDSIVRDDFTTGAVTGGAKNDHLIHHRASGVDDHVGTDLASYGGDDILEGSVPYAGQLHMFGAKGDDWLILDVTKDHDAIGIQGHHAYGGHGQDTFQFTNIADNQSPIVGRLDDFDPTSDRIVIEGTEIDLTDLPLTIDLPDGGSVDVRVVAVEPFEFAAENLGPQQFLAIGDDIFFALEGARDLANGTSDLSGEERHFVHPDTLETLRTAETVQYESPDNFAPREFYEHREDELNLNWNPKGDEVLADYDDKAAAHMFGSKGNLHSHHSSGEPVMRGGDGDDVIDGNSGNDRLFGGPGDDLIAGGLDNDVVHGGSGNDMIWGGDGNDSLRGGSGNDFLKGGRGDDDLAGGEGHDTLFGGSGDNTLTGGGDEDAVNRFHFYEEPGQNIITDFKVGVDLVTLQDDIDPLTVELYENDAGNTVLNYGESGSVELEGVALAAFREAAELRAEDDNPIITITPDPEEEMLRELRIETGYFGDTEPPDLMVEGIQYGATPFQDASGEGGYAYVSETDGDDGRDDREGSGGDGGPDEEEDDTEHDDVHPLPAIPSEEEDDEHPAAEDEEGEQGTCFVATAAYRDPWHPDVVFLRDFRDQWLVHRAWGRAFVAFYWCVGPKMAAPVRSNHRLARPAKTLISQIVRMLRRTWTVPENIEQARRQTALARRRMAEPEGPRRRD